jgi:transposase-like protein
MFTTDQAALKTIYLAAMSITNKWKKSRFGWPKILNQLYIYFENRIH